MAATYGNRRVNALPRKDVSNGMLFTEEATVESADNGKSAPALKGADWASRRRLRRIDAAARQIPVHGARYPAQVQALVGR